MSLCLCVSWRPFHDQGFLQNTKCYSCQSITFTVQKITLLWGGKAKSKADTIVQSKSNCCCHRHFRVSSWNPLYCYFSFGFHCQDYFWHPLFHHERQIPSGVKGQTSGCSEYMGLSTQCYIPHPLRIHKIWIWKYYTNISTSSDKQMMRAPASVWRYICWFCYSTQ